MNKRLITAGTIFLLFGISVTSIINDDVIASPGSINVDTPSYGSVYYEGNIIPISWSYSPDSGDWVKIELYQSGYFCVTITSNTSNDGYYSWTIPSGYSSTGYFQVKVESLTDSYATDLSDIFYIRNKYITVTSPSRGETWFRGETHTILWDSENAGNYVKIEYKIGSSYYTIESSFYNNGYYSWTIPSFLSSSSSYQIKITSTSDYSVYGYSDYFSIGERSITITSPSGGEIWYKEETYTIKWTSENAGNYVYIEYKKESSYYYTRISSSTENDGRYDWTIPKSITSGSKYIIKISSYSYSDVYDISNYFSIDQRYIEVNSPYRYDKWYPNETYTITWDSENAGYHVNIRLYKDEVYCATIASDLENSGSYTWTIPDIFSPDYSYKILIRSVEYNGVYDYSDEFSIGERIIKITSPTEEEVWYKGETYTITWESENAGYTVDIELYKDGKKYLTIDSYVSNHGSYTWRIPDDLPDDSSYQIKITSPLYSEVYTYSEGNFTIEESIMQKVSGLLLVTLIVVIIFFVAFKVIRKVRKGKKTKPADDVHGGSQSMRSPVQPSQTEMTPEEYEQIWES